MKSSITHIVNLELSSQISKQSHSANRGLYGLETLRPMMIIQVLAEADSSGNLDIQFVRIKDAEGKNVFLGDHSSFISLEPDEDGNILDTAIISLRLRENFGDTFAYELGDFIENLLSWIDPESSLQYLDREFLYTLGLDEVRSRRVGTCYIFRTIGVAMSVDSQALSEETLDRIASSADFDELDSLDLGVILF